MADGSLDLETVLALKTAIVLGTLAVFALYERMRPADPRPLLLRLGHATRAAWRRLGRNVSLFGLNVLLSPLIVIPITAWAASHELGLRPAWWSGWTGLALDLLVLDLWIYWWHRANHEIPFLWRFHEVHHLDEMLDCSSALRFHFGEVLLSSGLRAAVIVAFGMPVANVVLFEALVLACAIFHHSDARLPPALERALAIVVVTPSIHWVHHHARRVDTDSNYGNCLSVWDRLFATRNRRARAPGMAIGVEGGREQSLVRLVLAPFRARLR